MDSAKSWFQKFQPRDRLRSSGSKKDSMGSSGREDPQPLSEEEASNLTKQRVAAAKQYIENHYKEQMKNLQERRERYGTLFDLLYLDCVIYILFYLEDCGFIFKILQEIDPAVGIVKYVWLLYLVLFQVLL